MERNGKPCYANNVAPKSFVIRVMRTALINMTAPSHFTKKVSITTITKKTHRQLSKGIYSTPAKLQFSSFYELITREYYHK